MKRLTSLFLVLAMLLTFAPMNIFAADADKTVFSDMKDTDYYATAATALEQLDILAGYPDGTFGAEKSITRAEMAAVVCRMIDKETAAEDAKGATIFDDVKNDHWATGYINIASKEGIINGDGNGKFRPEDDVKYEEAIKMVVCALGYGKGIIVDAADWSKGYLEVATQKGISDGLKGVKGKAATRGDIAVMSYNGLATETATSKIPAAPVASKKAGEFFATQKVKLTTTTKDADIYYTTDGTTPTVKSTKYVKEISISKTTTLKAIAVKNGVASKVMSVEYTFKKFSGGGGGGGGSSSGGSTTTEYTVSFDLNYEGATGAPAAQTVEEGETATEPADPKRDGYEFKGWFVDQACETAFDFATAITGAVTLYAKWEKIDVSIELTTNKNTFFTDVGVTQVPFYAKINNNDGYFDTVVLQDENDQLIATLYDDGKYSENGDEFSNDDVYSCIVYLNLETESVCTYKVVADGSISVVSNEVKISVIPSMTTEQIENMNKVDNSIQDDVFQSEDYADMELDERAQLAKQLLDDLIAQGLVVEGTVQYNEKNGTYTFMYESGALGSIILKDWAEDQNGVVNNLVSQRAVEPVGNNYLMNQVGGAGSDGETNVGSGATTAVDVDAIVLWSFDQAWDEPSYRRPFYNQLEQSWEDEGVDTIVVWDTTVENYKNLEGYEIIVFSGHGDFDEYTYQTATDSYSSLLLHERSTKSKDEEYKNDLKLFNIGRTSVLGGTMYAILPNFWDAYYDSGDLDGSFVFAENCEFNGEFGTENLTMANEILGLSAECVVGFHNSVMADYSRDLMKFYFDKLIEGMTAGEAYDAAKAMYGDSDYFPGRENYGPTAYPIFSGDTNAAFVETEFENGSFEDSTPFNGWKKKGDVRLLSKLGALVPQHEDKMAILTTGIGSGTSDYMEATEGSVLYQTFKVPADVTTLSFTYNVVSEEPMEYVNSQFDDKFWAELVTSDKNTTHVLAQESVNEATWYAIDEIDFDGGDSTTYETKWKTVSYDLSAYQNQLVTIRFIVYDVGDSIYDTAALIDNVVISGNP